MNMQRRLLGATGIEVSVLGLGTVKLGRNTGVKYPHAFELPDDAAAARLLARARELGINLVDTAPAYGVSEERLGALLAGQRRDWVICTKVGEEFDGAHSRFDFSPAHVRASIERSLRRLRSDYLDIVLLHSNGDDIWVLNESGAFETLLALKQDGLVRAVGISHKTVAGGRLGIARCDVVMAALNPNYLDEVAVIGEAGRRGVGVLVKKAFASGSVADDAEARRRCLALALGTAGVSSVVIGTVDPAHLADNVTLAAGPE
jgi:aryl-alcohol dehydrogenase-like predicted oxidoreductase